MKFNLALASASLLVLSACGTSQEALQALQTMQILENNAGDGISYEKLSGSGNDVTLSNVSFKAPAAALAAMSGEADGSHPPPVAVTPGDSAAPAPAPAPHTMPTDSGPMVVAKAETMKLKGLTMKEGKPVFRDMQVSGITPGFPTEGATIRLGSINLEGLNEATGTFIASGFTKDGAGAPPKFEDWAFKKASINGLDVAVKIDQDEGEAGAVNFKLGELSFSDLGNRMLGLARLGGIKGDLDIPGTPAIKGTFDLGTFDVEKIRTGMFADAFAAGMASMEPGAEKPDYAALFKDYTSPLEAGYDAVKWTGANVDVSGIKFTSTPVETRLTRNADGVVVAHDTPRYSMKLSADSAGGSAGAMGLMMLAMTGYPSNQIELYAEGHATFDPAKDLTHWDNYNVGVSDLLDVKMSGGILGLEQAMPTLLSGVFNLMDAIEATANDVADQADDEADENADEGEDSDDSADEGEDSGDDADDDAPDMGKAMDNPEVMQAAMQLGFALMSLQLTDLDMAVTDKQLVDLILSQAAVRSGQSAAALRQDLVTMISSSGELMTGVGVDADIANEATAALAGFLSGPGTLRLQLKPKNPIGAMSLMMAPTKESLGFSMTFTPAEKTN